MRTPEQIAKITDPSELNECILELIEQVHEFYQRWQEDRRAQGLPMLEPLSGDGSIRRLA